jgi:hypothetical protein
MTGTMGRPERRRAMAAYVTGLLLDDGRKSVVAMANRLVDDDSDAEAIRQRLQQCVTLSTWAFNLVRFEMEHTADQAGVPPARISFITAPRMIRDEWLCSAVTGSPGAIPRHLRELREDLERFILPERRSERSYPRAVPIEMSNHVGKEAVCDETGA